MTVDAVGCALAGIRAVDPTHVTRDAVQQAVQAGLLHAPLSMVSVGKAAQAMSRGAMEGFAGDVTHGVIVAPTPSEHFPDRFATFVGGHPIPNVQGMRGAEGIEGIAMSLREGETLLCLISGGASALSMLPAIGISLADVQQMTTALLRAGATINEVNCVRKHIDRLKGGRLARLAAPAKVVAFVLSDVIGDPLDVIASGPTVPDTTTIADAIAILHERNVWNAAPDSIRRHLERGKDESPKPGEPYFADTHTRIIGNNRIAAEAAKVHAESLGYQAAIETLSLDGEARELGAQIAQHARDIQSSHPGERRCVVYAGESTVTVTGSGTGGRNQELALAAAIALDGTTGITVTSVGTDGIDGPTDAAGAVACGDTISRAQAQGLDANAALQNNDAYPFWKALGDLVMTGPTGTNVMDLVVVTVEG